MGQVVPLVFDGTRFAVRRRTSSSCRKLGLPELGEYMMAHEMCVADSFRLPLKLVGFSGL